MNNCFELVGAKGFVCKKNKWNWCNKATKKAVQCYEARNGSLGGQANLGAWQITNHGRVEDTEAFSCRRRCRASDRTEIFEKSHQEKNTPMTMTKKKGVKKGKRQRRERKKCRSDRITRCTYINLYGLVWTSVCYREPIYAREQN